MKNAVRKGEWLEIRLDANEGISAEQAEFAALSGLNMPAPLLSELKKDNGITHSGNRLRIRLFPDKSFGFTPEWKELNILYEDDFCLVVNKPAGTAIHPTAEGQGGTLAHHVAAYYEMTGQQCAVRHIHRLDRDTTGPVLYAKNEFSQYLLDESMRRKAIVRIYVAVVSGKLAKPQGILDYPIGRDRHHKQRRRISAKGDRAVTHYEVVERYKDASLVRLLLETGRTHQIRVHLSHIGHPLLGDTLYGGSDAKFGRQALHGERLVFPHPFSKEVVAVEAPWPEDLLNLVRLFKK